MVEMRHKDTGFPIETIGPSHDTSTCISFNNLIGWPDKNRAKLLSLPRRAGVLAPTPVRCATAWNYLLILGLRSFLENNIVVGISGRLRRVEAPPHLQALVK